MLKTDFKESASSSQISDDLCYNLEKTKLNNDLNLTLLPSEILHYIFKICPIKEQLILAKVCKHFRQIIQDIYKKTYKLFTYNNLTLKCEHLKDDEIRELCSLCGEFVQSLRFNAMLNQDLLEYINWSGICTITLDEHKNCLLKNFKGNLKYFPNLQELEVQGNLLQDQHILKLSEYCKNLKTLRLLDNNNVNIKGEYLTKLKAIVNLEIKSCENLDYNFVLKVSKKRKLKTLNIMECKRLEDISKIMNLCKNWQYLETLRLTAFSSEPKLINAIINLPLLKILQFFAISQMPLNFEEILLQQLKNHKTKSLLLKQIKFENDIYNLDSEILEKLSPKMYAEKREFVVVNNRPWQMSKDDFFKFSQKFENLINLKTLEFYYCRVLNYQQIKRLCVINQKLELIKIYGCPMQIDDLLQKCWQEDEFTKKCQLQFEKRLLSCEEVMELKKKYSCGFIGEEILRSIECQFDV